MCIDITRLRYSCFGIDIYDIYMCEIQPMIDIYNYIYTVCIYIYTTTYTYIYIYYIICIYYICIYYICIYYIYMYTCLHYIRYTYTEYYIYIYIVFIIIPFICYLIGCGSEEREEQRCLLVSAKALARQAGDHPYGSKYGIWVYIYIYIYLHIYIYIYISMYGIWLCVKIQFLNSHGYMLIYPMVI